MTHLDASGIVRARSRRPLPTETIRTHGPHRLPRSPRPPTSRGRRRLGVPPPLRRDVVARGIVASGIPTPRPVLTDTSGRTIGSDAVDESIVALVPEAAAGNQVAFTRLVAAFHADMVRVAYVVCGGDGELAQDAAQSAWAIAWSRLRTLREPERVRSWLVSVAANKARQAVRQRRRVVAVGLDDVELPAEDGVRTAGELDLGVVLGRLTAEERMLIGLRYVAGLDSTEIGRALGMSASGVRSRLERLLGRIRRELGDG